MNAADPLAVQLTELHRSDYGRILSAVTRVCNGDIELAEDVVQESFAVAADVWRPTAPANPAGWIYRTARNKAVDAIRRNANLRSKSPLLAEPDIDDGDDFDAIDEDIPDERLRLIFTCCHPALPTAAQIALTLKTVAGLTTTEVARALLLSEPTLAQRIVRAKRRLGRDDISYSVPSDSELPDRLPAVLGVIYLIFTEGHSATERPGPVRVDLCREAIRLAGQLLDLMPDEAEVMGALALMYLTDARRPARVGSGTAGVPLSDQDRSKWNRREMHTGAALLERALRRSTIGPYQLQAAIAAQHDGAPSWDDTDWERIVALYRELEQHLPSPVIRLNRAVAESYATGPEVALVSVEALRSDLSDYQPWHATRADLLMRLGEVDQAASAFDEALRLASNDADRALLRKKKAGLLRR